MAQEGEASVEEILESIKKVIARDNREGAMQARRRRTKEADQAEADHAAAAQEEEVLDLSSMQFLDADIPEDGAQDDEGETPLTTDAVRGAMRENLAALAMLAEPGAPPQIVRSGETSLEGLTRELLRPMLAEWLDKNMPGIVEKLVQAEIARIAGKRR
jgi:hypothetical protein